MERQWKLFKSDCKILVTDDCVSVERKGTGFSADHNHQVCNIWKEETNRVRYRVFNFIKLPTKGETEEFTIVKGNWVVEFTRWFDGSYMYALWEGNRRVSTLEWSEDGKSAYVDGDPSSFIRFVDETV